MLDDLFDTLTAFVQSFRRTTPFPIEILVPGLLILSLIHISEPTRPY